MKYILIIALSGTPLLAQQSSDQVPPPPPSATPSSKVSDLEKEKQKRLDELDRQARELTRIWKEKQRQARLKQERERQAEIQRQKQIAAEKAEERKRLEMLDKERRTEFERIKQLQEEAERLRLERVAEEERIRRAKAEAQRLKEEADAKRRQAEEERQLRELQELKRQRMAAEQKIAQEKARQEALKKQLDATLTDLSPAVALPPPPPEHGSMMAHQPHSPSQGTKPHGMGEFDATTKNNSSANPSMMGSLSQQMSKSGQNLVDGEIDRMGLATSLFGINDWKGCLRAMESIDPEELTAENQRWIQYLHASCHRKLGNISEAESSYRKLLSQEKKGWLADAGRWWLDHINERRKTETSLQELRSQTVAWRAELEKLRSDEQPGI